MIRGIMHQNFANYVQQF